MEHHDTTRTRIALDWQVGFSNGVDIAPERLVPAKVPGAVQLDWARATGLPDHNYADNFTQYAWMEDVYWHYRAQLPQSQDPLTFVCGGVDYHFIVRVNGDVVYDQEGMFTPFEIPLQNRSGGGIEVIIRPAPKSVVSPIDRTQANHSCKPAVSYGWDWHPRLVPLGIWCETYVEVRPTPHLRKAELRYALSDDLSHADLRCEVEPAGVLGKVRWTLEDPQSRPVFSELLADCPSSISAPQLWWPAGEGPQSLYRSIVELLDASGGVIDRLESRTGFRRMKLVMAPDQWQLPNVIPKSRTHPPITLEINNRSIFCRGSNWVNPEIFPGAITRKLYASLLHLARDAHFNLLRIWGGGIINKPDFYELCDELGLMVWQEFPLACNTYPDAADYLRVLDQESKSIIAQLRVHPCIAMWCGGNELFNAWGGMTDQSLPLRLLNRNCYDGDPTTPFLPTSPVDGMAHGNYVFRYDGREPYEAMTAASYTAYTEFGCGGPSPVEVLKECIPPDELFPPKPGTAWQTHHGLRAWQASDWLALPTIEHYFGPCESLEQMVSRGEWLQCEGFKCIYEEARRQKPVCSMALNWCFNEPWPTAAGNSLINYPDRPKPAYYAVKAACRPTMASARLSKFQWNPGNTFEAEVWLLHDGVNPIEGVTIDVIVQFDDKHDLVSTWNTPAAAANTHVRGPTARLTLPSVANDHFVLTLSIRERPEWSSSYRLSIRPAKPPVPFGTPTMNV